MKKFIILILVVAGIGYFYWQKTKAPKGPAAIPEISKYGFELMPVLENTDPNAVIIFTQEKLSTQDAERAGALADELSRAGLQFTRSSKADFSFTDKPDAAMMAKLNRIMNGKPPTVFVRGRAKSNPTAADVIAEYKSGGN